MLKFTVQTNSSKEVIDLSPKINLLIKKARFKKGLIHLFVAHTTCALTTADLDPGTDQDLLEALAKMFPQGHWRHPHNPAHVGDHIMSSLVGASLTVPVEEGKLVLGTWQRVVLVELSGPRKREIVWQLI